jgi:hypothetical protein
MGIAPRLNLQAGPRPAISRKKPPPQDRRRPVLTDLEPRLLLSADPQAVLADPDLGQDRDGSEPAVQLALLDHDVAASQGAVQSRRELVIIDPGADDSEQLVADLRAASESDRLLDVVVLDRDRDGIAQISEILAGYDNLDALHIVSHGSNGEVQLGSTRLGAVPAPSANAREASRCSSSCSTPFALFF